MDTQLISCVWLCAEQNF